MRIEEANMTIAKYMGFDRIQNDGKCDFCGQKNYTFFEIDGGGECMFGTYSESLDALVPVWEKLECFIDISGRKDSKEKAEVFMPYMKTGLYETGKTIQEASCIATAKAILELQKEI